jgi:hypothetical protein
MAFVHARARSWPLKTLEFVVVGHLDGAVAAFAAGTADVFFWEKVMTQPLVDAGRFRRVGEFSAPWPAFVLCVAERVGPEGRAELLRALEIVLEEARALRARADAPELIAARYGLAREDVVNWLASTRWSERAGIAPGDLAAACSALNELGVLGRHVEPSDCLLS